MSGVPPQLLFVATADPAAGLRGGMSRTLTECRLASPDFDVAASAGWYSAIAGVLAGFALLAILFPLDHESAEDAPGEGPGPAESVVVFTCAFFSLLILGLTYAVLAGRTGDGPELGVAVHEQLLNGAAFGLAVLLLLFGLRSVLSVYGRNRQIFEPGRNVILMATALFGPIVALSLQFSNSLDIERYRGSLAPDATDCGFAGIPNGVWVNLAITAASLVAVVVLALLRHRLRPVVGAATFIAKGVLVFCVVVVAWSSLVVPLLPVDVLALAVFEHVTLAATGVATVIVAAAAWSAR